MPQTIPCIDNVLTDAAVSRWLKDALRAALVRDPVDAANDAVLLSVLLASRAEALLFTDMARPDPILPPPNLSAGI